MKQSISLSLVGIACLLMVVACDKKDDPSNPLIGTWKFASQVRSGCTDPLDNGSETCTLTLDECGYLVLTATTYTYYPPTGTGSSESGTYVTSGSTLTSTPTGGVANDPLTYTVSGGTLTFTGISSGTGCTEVQTLTKQ